MKLIPWKFNNDIVEGYTVPAHIDGKLFNMSYNGIEDKQVLENRKELAKMLDTDLDHMVAPLQRHTTHYLSVNKKDGGNRKFILVEMGDYADTITAERVKRVIDGYGEGKNAVDGTGGNFSYYELGSPLFLQDGTINNDIDTAEIRKYIWYTETNGLEYAENEQEKYYLGSHNDTAYYFYYEKEKATILDYSFLATVSVKTQAYIIYADSCSLSDIDLQKWNITFKKIPRDIEHI